jgi:pimeloyl-ACP methyl ester carboxylesterase
VIPGESGHGADAHRGRFASGVASIGQPVERAMRALLATAPGAAAARSAYAEIGGSAIHYLEAGHGEAVVLLHGGGGGGANWFRLIGPLAAAHRVFAPDLPGFGLSPPRVAQAPLGTEGAAVIADWLDALEVRHATVIATSFGGLIALRLAQRRPDLVARLGLISSVGLGREATWLLRIVAMPLIGPAALRPSRRGIALTYRLLLTSNRERVPPAQERALLEYLWCSAANNDARAFARAVHLFAGVRGQREVLSREELSALALPTAIIWGARDRFLPVHHAVAAARALPHATCTIIERSGHSPNWEAPDAVLASLSTLLATPV